MPDGGGNLHLVLRLRKSRAIPLFPLWAFMPSSRMNCNLSLPLLVPLHVCACVQTRMHTHTHTHSHMRMHTRAHMDQSIFYGGITLKGHIAGNASHGITARQVRSSKYQFFLIEVISIC